MCGPPNNTVKCWPTPAACFHRACGQYTEYASLTTARYRLNPTFLCWAAAERAPGGCSGGGRGDLVHEVGEAGQDVRAGLRQDAVTQVEGVAAECAGAGEDRAGAGLDHLPAGQQHRGVEVALQRLA